MGSRGAPGAHRDAGDDPRWRTLWWINLGTLALVALSTTVFALQTALVVGDAIAVWRRVGAVALSVPLAVLSIRMVWLRVDGEAPTRRLFWTTAGLLAAVLAGLDMWVGTAFVAGAWWAAAGVSNPVARMAAPTAALLAVPWARALFFDDPDWGLVAVLVVAAAGWGLFLAVGHLALLFLWDLAAAAAAGTRARARLAVSEERLRFARDMHDLLGHRLTGIAVTSELAARLAERAPDQAADRMREVQEASREALREMRGAVSGYREMDLAQELDAARGVLSSSGTRCTVEGAPEDVPEALRPLAAWVVREGATNVVRHSEAERCTVVLRREDGRSVVEVRNDGAPGTLGGEGSADPAPGNGITGLTERVAAAGGTLTAARDGDAGFLLRAVLPDPGAGEPPVPGGEAAAPGAAEDGDRE
ncbi:sensor histidine kinase [Nocardiopsis halophila]|uniref:sensor histidine kinase n=1 Tax=Nocardiopsis halophila TaxID=141692 RepID=UPI00036D2576|nr:histidine kinase [Nocardiopsis halophila]